MRPMFPLDIPDRIRDSMPETVKHLTTGPMDSILSVGRSREVAAGALAFRRAYRVMFGDVEKMDLEAHHDMFDAIVFSDPLERLANPERSLKAVAPCLRKGASVYAIYAHTPRWRIAIKSFLGRDHFPADHFVSLFERSGYQVLKFEPLSADNPSRMLIAALPEQA